jgi:hypothetical protein
MEWFDVIAGVLYSSRGAFLVRVSAQLSAPFDNIIRYRRSRAFSVT